MRLTEWLKRTVERGKWGEVREAVDDGGIWAHLDFSFISFLGL